MISLVGRVLVNWEAAEYKHGQIRKVYIQSMKCIEWD